LIYPGKAPAPLTLLGELANWSTPSPLGLGLHTQYGPWFAYRALVKTTTALQTHTSTNAVTNFGDLSPTISNADNSNRIDILKNNVNATTSPCLRCTTTPCVSACPGNAVSVKSSFSIDRCATSRIKDNSICKEQCHARNACPVGVEYRYSEEQSAHHMTRALQALVNWAKDD